MHCHDILAEILPRNHKLESRLCGGVHNPTASLCFVTANWIPRQHFAWLMGGAAGVAGTGPLEIAVAHTLGPFTRQVAWARAQVHLGLTGCRLAAADDVTPSPTQQRRSLWDCDILNPRTTSEQSRVGPSTRPHSLTHTHSSTHAEQLAQTNNTNDTAIQNHFLLLARSSGLHGPNKLLAWMCLCAVVVTRKQLGRRSGRLGNQLVCSCVSTVCCHAVCWAGGRSIPDLHANAWRQLAVSQPTSESTRDSFGMTLSTCRLVALG